jgi:hypothetical protein
MKRKKAWIIMEKGRITGMSLVKPTPPPASFGLRTLNIDIVPCTIVYEAKKLLRV